MHDFGMHFGSCENELCWFEKCLVNFSLKLSLFVLFFLDFFFFPFL